MWLCRVFQAVGGNIMTASPISDLNPVFMAAGCKLTLVDKGNSTHFYSGWHKVLIKIQTKLSIQGKPPEKTSDKSHSEPAWESAWF